MESASWEAFQALRTAGSAKSVNTSKQRSCDSIRCSHCCWRDASVWPEAKVAAPQARSCPANSLPCMKLNMATSAREISGSVALSAASKTTTSRPAISRVKAAVDSSGVVAWAPARWRRAGRASSACSTKAMRLKRRAPLRTRAGAVSSASKCCAHELLDTLTFSDLLQALLGKAHALRAEEHIGNAPFLLQGVDQAANGIDQLAGERKLFEFADFALARGDKKTESGLHHGCVLRVQQHPCRKTLQGAGPAGTLYTCPHAGIGNRVFLR
jgi:hypothetical protein